MELKKPHYLLGELYNELEKQEQFEGECQKRNDDLEVIVVFKKGENFTMFTEASIPTMISAYKRLNVQIQREIAKKIPEDIKNLMSLISKMGGKF